MKRTAGCYLLHFEGDVHGAQHYLGWSVHIARRIRQHLSGKGARLVRKALRAGISVELVRVWQTDDNKYERLLKKRGHPKRYCPRCGLKPEQAPDEVLQNLQRVPSRKALARR